MSDQERVIFIGLGDRHGNRAVGGSGSLAPTHPANQPERSAVEEYRAIKDAA